MPPRCWRSKRSKQLKARYCRHLDTKDWQAWRSLFTDDFLSDTSPAGGKVIQGADDFVAFTRKSLRSQATVHQVHAPEIELTSATTARGVWALEDVVRFGPGVNLRGYGHYTETYEKVDGQWFIASSTLTRLRGRCLQRLCLGVHLGTDPASGRQSGAPGDEVTGSTVDTVLITGAFGQVGKRCAEILLSRGRTVIATDLRNDKSVAVAQELAARSARARSWWSTPICWTRTRSASSSPRTVPARWRTWPR